MRRAVAALMSVLFSLMLITPAFAAPADGVPQCCLREGKHHCTMGKSTQDGPAVVNARCAQFQLHGATVAQHNPGLTQSIRTTQPDVVRVLSVLPAAQNTVSVSLRSAHPRGPPQL